MTHTVEIPAGQQRPLLSGYVCILNGIRGGFPFIEAAESLCGFCDEVVIMDGESDDGTVRALQMFAKNHPQVRVVQNKYNRDFPLMDGMQKQIARSACNGKVVFQLDADEYVHESGWHVLRNFASQMTETTPVIALPIINTLGKADRANCEPGATPWKWRMSYNHHHIGHGVEISQRRVNPGGVPYAANGDGCEWIDFRTGKMIQPEGFVAPVLADPLQMSVMMENVSRQFPTVWHVGEADLLSKAKRFTAHWKKQWQALRQHADGLESKTWGTDLDMENPTEEDYKRAVENYVAAHKTYKVWQQPPQGLNIWLRKVGAL